MKAGPVHPAAIARKTLAADRAAMVCAPCPSGGEFFLQNAIRVFAIVVFFVFLYD